MPDGNITIWPVDPLTPSVRLDPDAIRRTVEPAHNPFPETSMPEAYGIEQLSEVIAGVGDLGESIADVLADGKVNLSDIPAAVSSIVKTVTLVGKLPAAALEAADLSEEEIKILGPQAIAMIFRIVNKLKGRVA